MSSSYKVILERGPGFRSGIADLNKAINSKTIATGVVSAVFGMSVSLLIINAAADVGYDFRTQVSWVFGCYVGAGLISLLMALYYKKPIVGGWSMPGAAMLAVSLAGFTINQASFGFIMAGVIVLLLGVTGLIDKVMRWIPLPIVMGMIAGVMMRFATGMVTSTVASPVVGLSAMAGYFLMPIFVKKFPPVIAALAFGVLSLVVTGGWNVETAMFAYTPPHFIVPQANFQVIFSVSIPLAALVIGAENAQAIGIFFTQKYDPPINSLTITSGVFGCLAGLVGAHNANIAGPMTAICASEDSGEKEYRYGAAVVNGVLFVIFGALASFAISFVNAIPGGLVGILAGLALISVLINALAEGFGGGKYKVGAFIALVVGLSGITILGIGAPFWALVCGAIISVICDRHDFKKA